MAGDLILVTGASGFVGSAVARSALARGWRVRVLLRKTSDRSNLDGLTVEEAIGDLNDPASLVQAVEGCQAVAHVAADYRIWVPDPESMLRANVDGTRTLMLAAQQAGVQRIVYCSSVAALGLTGSDEPADEDTPVSEDKIVGIYKKSKYRAEQAVLRLVRERALPAVIVNPSAPVGPRDIKPTPTGKMVADAAAGKMPAYVATGLNVVHVDDVAEGHLLALERGRIGERYILGSENLHMHELLALVDAVTGRRQNRLRLPTEALYPVALISEALARFGVEPVVTRDHLRMAKKLMFFSHAKAARELGYTPRPARDAVADAVSWFRANGKI